MEKTGADRAGTLRKPGRVSANPRGIPRSAKQASLPDVEVGL